MKVFSLRAGHPIQTQFREHEETVYNRMAFLVAAETPFRKTVGIWVAIPLRLIRLQLYHRDHFPLIMASIRITTETVKAKVIMMIIATPTPTPTPT